ncbi:MAG: hypothetical protein ACT4P2_07645 [Pseudomonadota bacterium]
MKLGWLGSRAGTGGAWPRLPPRAVVAIGPDRQRHYFRLRLRLDGRVKVKRADGVRSGAFILALDPDLVYRRRAAFVPAAASEMRATAASLFPFDAEGTSYAAAIGPGGTEVFAAPRELRDELTDGLGEPQAIVVSAPSAAALTAAVNERLQRGEAADLGERPRRFMNPAVPICSALALALVGAMWGGIALSSAQGDALTQDIRKELRRAETAVAPLVQRREVIARMAVAMDEMDRLESSARGLTIETLGRVLVAVPPGVFIDKIEFAGDNLTLTGFGNQPLDWLGAFGVVHEDIIITKMPAADRFAARVRAKP